MVNYPQDYSDDTDDDMEIVEDEVKVKSVYQQLSDLGAELHNYKSDLRVKVTKEVDRLLHTLKYKDDHALYKGMRTFTSSKDKQVWYTIPGAYDPFWEKAKADAFNKYCNALDSDVARATAFNAYCGFLDSEKQRNK